MRDAGRVCEVNEDLYMIVEPEEATEAEARGRLFIVADGMGNQGAGEVAARLAADTVADVYYSGEAGDDPEESLRYALERAHVAVREAAHENPDYHKMGTTLTAMAIIDDCVYIAHVGDTRAYVVRRGKIAQLTEDHNWAGEQLRKGALTKVHAHTHPRRKLLTRSLGQTPQVEIDTKTDQIAPGDIFLICSDGLYDTLSEEEIERILLETSPEMSCRELVARANRNGGADNIAAIIVKTLFEGKPFLLKEPRRRFRPEEIFNKIPQIPAGFPFYLGLLAIAALVIIGGSLLFFRGCGGPENGKIDVPPPPTANLSDTGARAKVKITTAPSGAVITVDGTRIGPSPLTVDLPPGPHVLEINHEGYQIKKHKLEIKSGELQIPLNFILVPHPATRSPDMVFVKRGPVIVGRDDASSEEGPSMKIWLDAYYIDRYEVSNDDYKKFIEETGRPEPAFWDDPDRNGAKQPVVGVDWEEADAYCRWNKKRLPTEFEWEKAARGDDKKHYIYPWGNRFEPARANISGDADGFVDVGPVDILPEGKSPYGAYNCIGNVAEWTITWFGPDYYKAMPMKNPRGPETGTRRVVKGGSYKTSRRYATTTYRSAFAPGQRKSNIGFRCAKD